MDLIWLLILAFLITLIAVLVALRLRARLAVGHRDRWNELRPILSMSLVVWLAVFPACIGFAGTFPLLPTKVCVKGGSEQTGLLVGETGDRIYLGESGGRVRQVISLPLTQVAETFIGGQASSERCS